MGKLELLAPAGNFECLVAAVQSGADAVYLSGKAFGARSFAANFDNDEIKKAIDYCHIRDVKVYVTTNTIVSDSEIDEIGEYLLFLSEIGADGIIVQDLGVLEVAKKLVPDLPVHASTQMTIHNSEGVKALEKLGVKRVVLSRELSIENIKEISRQTSAELELFGHGALCMSYSGQCLMSSIIGGRSGNRGKCAQPCRLLYSVNGKNKKAFYMSLKDLSSLEHIKTFKEMGVASLKIEGRMKGPAYVAAVVSVYRKYIDNPQKIDGNDIKLLDSIFNRGGLTDGYLTKKKGPDMFAFDKPDNPYHKETDELVSNILNEIKNEKRKLILDCKAEIKNGEKPKITVLGKGFEVEVSGEKQVEKAKQSPLTVETVKTQIGKTGGTPFEFSDISVYLDEGVFVSAGELNALRRNALDLFEEKYLNSFRRNNKEALTLPKLSDEYFDGGNFVCEVTTVEQFLSIKDFGYKLFYIPVDLIQKKPDIFAECKEKTVIVPPAIIDESVCENIFESIEKLLNDGYYAVLAHNIAVCERFKNFNVIGSFRLNIFNSYALEFYKNARVVMTELSAELNFRQIKAIKKPIPVQVMAYGRLPLMVTENCIIKNANQCPCSKNSFITDRLGMTFPIIKDGNSCRNVVLNCKKTFMTDAEKLKNAGVSFSRIYFTDETPDECVKISDAFLNGTNYRPQDFTNGHFLKGVK
ncbi:MAG: U32 family peptidase [Clostridia bacterium]|nr:U32 family peptidase [Clostridia bacterium]